MQAFDIKEHSHTRINILTGDQVLVSPHRSKRPWQGQVEAISGEQRPQYDASCYLCPGNERAGGQHNPSYTETFVFVNDFAALQSGTPAGHINENDLLIAQSNSGICKVICFSPRHDLTLPEMDVETIKHVVDVWINEFTSLAADPAIHYVQIFENKGAVMGCSNPHPHGQIWSQNSIPLEPSKETERQHSYFEKNGRGLLADYLQVELYKQERIVLENEHFVVVVPFWATWPYETLVIPRKQSPNILSLGQAERYAYADILQKLTIKYDNLFQTSFPYSSGIHQAPTDGSPYSYWHWHMHFYPPLLRSASVKKFMVGYEMLGNPQRDITPEYSAKVLRDLSVVHYKHQHTV